MDSTLPLTHGAPPDLAGARLEALVCSQFRHQGQLVDACSVIYLKLAGKWHRLCLDAGVLFWSEQDEPPQPDAVPDEGWEYPLVNLGQEAGVVGGTLRNYQMEPIPGGVRVAFTFTDGRELRFDDVDDVTRCWGTAVRSTEPRLLLG